MAAAGIPLLPLHQSHPAFCADGNAGFASTCALPMFFTLTPKSVIKAVLLGMEDVKEDKLEKSWCGQWVSVRIAPAGNPFGAGTPLFQTVSRTWCRPSATEIIKLVMLNTKHATDAKTGVGAPTKEEDKKTPFIDNMDPPKAYLDATEEEVGGALGLFTVTGFLFFFVLCGAGAWLIMKGMNAEEPAQGGDVENQVRSAA